MSFKCDFFCSKIVKIMYWKINAQYTISHLKRISLCMKLLKGISLRMTFLKDISLRMTFLKGISLCLKF